MAARDSPDVFPECHSPYRQFSFRLGESTLGEFLTLFKKAAYFAVFAHAPQVSTQVTPRYDAWEWAKHHARIYMDAPSGASFDRRSVIGGTAGALDRALIAMVRVKFALHWPVFLRSEFTSVWQELSECRMTVFGLDLEPSASGSPSKRIAEEMRACWDLDPQVVADASPVGRPDGDPTEHDISGNWASSDENAGSRPAAPTASPAPHPVRSCPGPGSGAVPQAASAIPPASGWDSRIEEVMKKEEIGFSAPLEGWSRERPPLRNVGPPLEGRTMSAHRCGAPNFC